MQGRARQAVSRHATARRDKSLDFAILMAGDSSKTGYHNTVEPFC
jgi:hypothetical protein